MAIIQTYHDTSDLSDKIINTVKLDTDPQVSCHPWLDLLVLATTNQPPNCSFGGWGATTEPYKQSVISQFMDLSV
jgi:hypothetical protein